VQLSLFTSTDISLAGAAKVDVLCANLIFPSSVHNIPEGQINEVTIDQTSLFTDFPYASASRVVQFFRFKMPANRHPLFSEQPQI
jgi:hypothetical protein